MCYGRSSPRHPQPALALVRGETLFAAYEGRQPDTERSVVLGAINGALQARHSLRGANEAGPLRRALKQLLAS